MTRDEEAAVVLGLACLTEDRTESEQKVMLRFARHLDDRLNRARWRQLVHGKDSPISELELLADATRVLVDDQKPVTLPTRKRRPWVDA